MREVIGLTCPLATSTFKHTSRGGQGKSIAIFPGLAPILRVEVFNKLKEIHAKGMSILLVEQNIPQLADIAKKIYLMEEGSIVFSGDKAEALDNQDFREAFLGM